MDWVPHINWSEPENEREHARHIFFQLHRLDSHEQKFRTALALIDHIIALKEGALAIEDEHLRTRERSRLTDWLFIPVENAAFEIYHFQSTLRSIRDQLKHAPALAKKVDSKKLQAAYDRFHAEFPQWKVIRDFIGHTADKFFSPKSVKELGEGVIIHHSLAGERQLMFTDAGNYVYFDATEETADRLRSIKREVYEAFRKASAWQPLD